MSVGHSNVVRPYCKAICLKSKERVGQEASPEGCLLLVLARFIYSCFLGLCLWFTFYLASSGSGGAGWLAGGYGQDLAAVNPTSLRMAFPQLSSTTIYTTLLSSAEFYNQWNGLANFIMMDSFLQVEVSKTGLVLPKPRLVSSRFCQVCNGFYYRNHLGGFRRRRQSTPTSCQKSQCQQQLWWWWTWTLLKLKVVAKVIQWVQAREDGGALQSLLSGGRLWMWKVHEIIQQQRLLKKHVHGSLAYERFKRFSKYKIWKICDDWTYSFQNLSV